MVRKLNKEEFKRLFLAEQYINDLTDRDSHRFTHSINEKESDEIIKSVNYVNKDDKDIMECTEYESVGAERCCGFSDDVEAKWFQGFNY